MRIKRWPALIVALGVGGTLLAPDDAGAGETRERVHAMVAVGGARMLVVQYSPTAALSVTTAHVGRPRKSVGASEPAITIDHTDPWTGEEIPVQPISRVALDMVDPWNGETILLPGRSFARLDALDPFDAK